MNKKLIIPFGLALFLLQAQTANRFALTIDNIMRGPGLVGYEPSQVRWSYDSERLYFQWKRAADKRDAPMDTYVVGRDGSDLRKLSEAEVKQVPEAGDSSADKRLTVFGRDGDIFVLDNMSGKIQQITKTTDVESNPRFLRDGKRISFVRANNLYVMALDTGLLTQVTDIRAAGGAAEASAAGGRGGGGAVGQGQGQGRGGRGGAAAASSATPERGSDSQEYLKKEQKDLFETIRERVALREEEDARRKKEAARAPFNLQARQSVTSLQLSPDEKYVIAPVSESAAAKNTMVHNFITESGYAEDMPGRPNVGDAQSTMRMAVINAESGEIKWVDHGQRRTPPPAPGAAIRGRRRPARARVCAAGPRCPPRPARLVGGRDQGRHDGARRRQQRPLGLRARSGYGQDARARQYS